MVATVQDVLAVIEECADLAAELRDGEPATMASACRELGLKLTYHAREGLVNPTACPGREILAIDSCPRGT